MAGRRALLGLGVDVDLDPSRLGEEVARDAISLRLAGLPPAAGREELLASILRRLDGVAPEEVLDEPDLLARWTALSPSSSGRRVVIEEAAIGEGGRRRIVRGTTRGIAADGALRLEREDGGTIEVRHGGTLRFETDADAKSRDWALDARRGAAPGGG
jgi:biotin-(acetyl-CoA carboxylase) ligase